MIRSVLHILLSFLLFATTTGLTISKHYCGENLISVSLFTEAEFCCENESCCHNETEYFQYKDDYVSSVAFNISSVVELNLLFTDFPVLISKRIIESEDRLVFIPESPPPLLTQTKLSLLQTYLI